MPLWLFLSWAELWILPCPPKWALCGCFALSMCILFYWLTLAVNFDRSILKQFLVSLLMDFLLNVELLLIWLSFLFFSLEGMIWALSFLAPCWIDSFLQYLCDLPRMLRGWNLTVRILYMSWHWVFAGGAMRVQHNRFAGYRTWYIERNRTTDLFNVVHISWLRGGLLWLFSRWTLAACLFSPTFHIYILFNWCIICKILSILYYYIGLRNREWT